MNIEIIGYIGGFCTTMGFLPQVIKTVKTNDTSAISVIYFVLTCIGVILWLVYGFFKEDKTIILANFVTLIFASVITFYKVRNVMQGKETL